MASVKKVPLRMCICCKQMKPKKEMLRVVKVNDNQFTLDETGKLNGRGAYICKEGNCIENSVNKKLLNKSYKQNVNSNVYELIKEKDANKQN